MTFAIFTCSQSAEQIHANEGTNVNEAISMTEKREETKQEYLKGTSLEELFYKYERGRMDGYDTLGPIGKNRPDRN